MAPFPMAGGDSYAGLVGGRDALFIQDSEMVAAQIWIVLVPYVIAVELAGVLQHMQVVILQIGIIQAVPFSVLPAALVRQIFTWRIAHVIFRPYAQTAVMVDPIDFLPDPAAVRFTEFRVVYRSA